MAATLNYNSVLARLEYAINSLHARGHQIDRGAAARALSYFSARASGAEYNEQAWRAAVEFMIEQGLCFEWVINGNVGSMIEMSASHFQGRTSIDFWDSPIRFCLRAFGPPGEPGGVFSCSPGPCRNNMRDARSLISRPG